MSIATDEAERRYPIEYSNFDCDVSKLSACRRAFALGAEWQSQRESTEAEIEAAARVFFGNLHYPSASLDWDKAAYSVKDNWRIKTRLALTAARKAVSADE